MAFSFKDLFGGFGGDSVLGIDIGTSSIKVVQLKKEKERAILETYGELSLGPYANYGVGQAAKLSEDVVVGAIKDLLRESNVKAKNVAVSIPLSSSFVTVISVPHFADNISEIIKMEAKKYIPVPISEVNLDWWVLPEKEKKANTEGDVNKKKFSHALLVAIHKDIISGYQSLISKIGLSVKAYELECFSMSRSCIGRESSPVAIVDMGASTTKIAIVDYGVMKSAHSINKGSQDLTLVLSHSLSVDFGRAEELKREIGLSDLPEHREMVTVIEPMLDYILSEVVNLIKDFNKKYQRSVGKVLLVGGGSQLKGLVDYSVKRLAISVEMAEPFNKVEYPVFLSKVLQESGVDFSVALGLALRIL